MDIQKPDDKAFNRECPICFSEDDEDSVFLILSCLHRFHEKCLEGHTELTCPTCRQNVVNWPPRLRSKIESNNITFRNELEENDRRALIQHLSSERHRSHYIYIQPPLEVELSSALRYLRENEIPFRYIPIEINITVFSRQPQPPPGTFFHVIVDKILLRISEDVEKETPEEQNSIYSPQEDNATSNVDRYIRITHV
jgi:hypothetical protein